MKELEMTLPRSVVLELVECLEEARRWHVVNDDAFKHRITLALDDFKAVTWEPVG